jgi:hypothetical protein
MPSPATIVNPRCIPLTGDGVAAIVSDRIYANSNITSIEFIYSHNGLSVNFIVHPNSMESDIVGHIFVSGIESGDIIDWRINAITEDGSTGLATGRNVYYTDGRVDSMVYMGMPSGFYQVVRTYDISSSSKPIILQDHIAALGVIYLGPPMRLDSFLEQDEIILTVKPMLLEDLMASSGVIRTIDIKNGNIILTGEPYSEILGGPNV